MPHYFRSEKLSSVLLLNGSPLIGRGDCVELVRHYSQTLHNRPSSGWMQGRKVSDVAAQFVPGTAIATFWNRHYPNWEHGNHAAFFIGVEKRDNAGKVVTIKVADQWANDLLRRPFVKIRSISAKPSPDMMLNGKPNMSNDLSFYYVVE